MAIADAVEGTLGPSNQLWFHYDIGNDILYVRLVAARDIPCYGDEQPDGTLLILREDSDEPVGVTIESWWKRYGNGAFPDSLSQIASAVEPWSKSIAA
ncbi:MAG: hypothetical protein ACR2IE_01880 [Candidatus Sumerlaeaceae bacterium]